MGTKAENLIHKDSCWNRADNDEPVFVLLGRDRAAPLVVREWIKLRVMSGKNTMEDKQIQDALSIIHKMTDYADYRRYSKKDEKK